MNVSVIIRECMCECVCTCADVCMLCESMRVYVCECVLSSDQYKLQGIT